jgi:transposase
MENAVNKMSESLKAAKAERDALRSSLTAINEKNTLLKEENEQLRQLLLNQEETTLRQASHIETLHRMIEIQRKEMDALLLKYVLRKKVEQEGDARQLEFDEFKGLLGDLKEIPAQAAAVQTDAVDDAQAESEKQHDEQEAKPTGKKDKVERPRHHGRQVIPAHLERVVEEIDIPEDEKIDPISGTPMKCIRYEDSEKLDYIPPKIFVHVLRRPVYEIPGKKSDFQCAELPPQALDKCKIGNGMGAEILVKRFVEHMPYERIVNWFGRHDVCVPRNDPSHWGCELGCNVLKELYEVHCGHILKGRYIGFDDTPIDLQVRSDGATYDGGLKSARIWVVRAFTGPPIMFYKFSLTKETGQATALLQNFQGYAHADAYAGHNEVMAKPGVIEVGCWAHVARKMKASLECHPNDAKTILSYIRNLYDVEEAAKGATPSARHSLRAADSQPVMDKMFDFIEKIHPRLLPKSPLAEATGYCLNQKAALQRYLTDGILEIDNNPTEREIRPWGIGRKNWLFFGSERGGEAAATIMSLTRSCVKLCINPWLYLKDVLDRLPTCPKDRLIDLIPSNWVCSDANRRLGVPLQIDAPKAETLTIPSCLD